MINIWVFIVTCIIFIGIMIWEFLRDRKLEDDYLDLKFDYDNIAMVLGYYSMRFGPVTTEDIINKVGIDMNKLKDV